MCVFRFPLFSNFALLYFSGVVLEHKVLVSMRLEYKNQSWYLRKSLIYTTVFSLVNIFLYFCCVGYIAYMYWLLSSTG